MLKRLFSLLKTYNDPSDWIKNLTWRYPKTISDLNLIFVVGSPRSGTSLLQKILSQHSSLFSTEQETGMFSMQNIFRKHFEFSSEVLDHLFNEANDIVDFFDKAVRLMTIQNGGKTFVEKTPQHVLYLPFIIKHFPNSKIINIIRDGRDCYCSSLSPPHIPQNKSIQSFARYWKKCVNLPFLTQDSDQILNIKYENIVSDPRLFLSSVMQFNDLELEENQLDLTYSGIDKRANLEYFAKLKEPIQNSSVGRWKHELSSKECDVFRRIAGSQLRYYDYDT